MKRQKGQIIIIALIFMAVVLVLVSSLVGYAGIQTSSHRQAVAKTQALSVAEAGIEAVVWKLNNQQGYNGEAGTIYGGGVYNVVITNLTGSLKLARVEAFVPDAVNPRAKRVLQATITIGSSNISFNYGVQVGSGGLKMDNNSTVNGNVYASGTIIGDNNGVRIAGTAISGGASGKIDEVDDIDADASAHFLEDLSVDGSTNSYSLVRGTVGGNVVATTISNCTVGGNATYDTRTSCTVGGVSTSPNPNDFVDPELEELPIPDEQVEYWEDEAESGGVMGSQTVNGTASLGPVKINGNLVLSNNSTLIVTGTIWVTGQVTLNQGSTLKLLPDYGTLSGVVLAGTYGSSTNGLIDAQNNSSILGSGTAGSYLMLLSQRNNTTAAAINVSNNASGAIFYAGYGVIEVSNGAAAKELTGYKIHINQNAVVTYESGLANALFSTGPGGGWEMLDGSWQLLQ